MVAQRHAVLCGGRPNQVKRRSMVAKLPCSVAACPEKFARKKDLNSHFKLAHKELLRPYECPDCEAQCSTWSNFRRHRKEKHGKSSHEPKPCSKCCYTTARQGNLDRHMIRQHPEGTDGEHEEEVEESELEVEEDGSSEAPADDEESDVDDAATAEGFGPMAIAIRNRMADMQTWSSGRELCEWERTRFNNLREQYNLLVASAAPEEAGGEGRRKRKSDGSMAVSRHSSRLQEASRQQEARLEARLAQQLEILPDDDDNEEVLVEVEQEQERDQVGDQVEEDTRREFICVICGKNSRDECNRRSHMERLHTAAADGVLPHHCTVSTCQLAFSTLWDMVVHRKTCLNQCSTCPFNTKRKQSWEKHVKKHPQ
jgi:hypothetical protein